MRGGAAPWPPPPPAATGPPPPPAAPWPPLVALLKIAKPAFWFIWVTPFAFGYIASAGSSPRLVAWFVLVALGICAVDAACNLHNELVDRVEDRRNQPNRTLLLDSLGERRAWALVVTIYAVGLAALVPIGLVVGADTVALIALGGAAALLYNAGPHLKRRPVLAQLAIGTAALSVFGMGWTWHRPFAELPAAGWLVVALVVAMGFLKDLPDAEGDRLVRAAGVFTVRAPVLRRPMVAAVYLGPFALLGALVTAGELTPRALVLLALLPAALWLAAAGERARTLHERVAAYQLVFLYVHAFMLVLLVAHEASGVAVAVAAALFAGRVLVLGLGLDPRLVEPDFKWTVSVSTMRAR